jgi:hypothetical protein
VLDVDIVGVVVVEVGECGLRGDNVVHRQRVEGGRWRRPPHGKSFGPLVLAGMEEVAVVG